MAKAKKPARSVSDIVQDLHHPIEEAFQDLSDEDYVEAMNELVDFCQSCADAKQEELDAADDDDAEEEEDEDEDEEDEE